MKGVAKATYLDQATRLWKVPQRTPTQAQVPAVGSGTHWTIERGNFDLTKGVFSVRSSNRDDSSVQADQIGPSWTDLRPD